MLHEKLWMTVLAWVGIGILPILFASLWIPDAVERLRASNERVLAEREARQ